MEFMAQPHWRGTWWLSLGRRDVPLCLCSMTLVISPHYFSGAAALLGTMLGVFAYRENGSCLESFLGQAKDTFSPLPYSLL